MFVARNTGPSWMGEGAYTKYEGQAQIFDSSDESSSESESEPEMEQ